MCYSQPAQVVVLRHAEKPEDPEALHLSPRGEERAKALVAFFTKDEKVTRFGKPVALYATRMTRRGRGQRPRETLLPTSRELGVAVQTPYESEHYEQLARDILRNPHYKDKTVVICWVHEYLPELAAALGVHPEPPKWKSSVYDKAYIISYSGGKAKLEMVNQKVLPGDRTL